MPFLTEGVSNEGIERHREKIRQGITFPPLPLTKLEFFLSFKSMKIVLGVYGRDSPIPHAIGTTPPAPLLQSPLSRFFVVPAQISTLTKEFFLGRNNVVVFSLGHMTLPTF